MEMNVRDVIRMLYVACDGNLDITSKTIKNVKFG